MKRQENQQPWPTAGCISVPLFNLKKRTRVPLTSAPSVNGFFSQREYVSKTSSATFDSSTSGTHGCHQLSDVSPDVSQTEQWNRQGVLQSPQPQQYDSNRPTPGPAPTNRVYTSMAHPYKAGTTSSMVGQSSYPVRQQDSTVKSRQYNYQAAVSSGNAQAKPQTYTGVSPVGQQLSSRLPSPTQQHPQQSRSLPPGPHLSKNSVPAVKPQSNTWRFTNSFESQTFTCEVTKRLNQPKTAEKTQTQQEVIRLKPTIENSLRILTAFIDGMRHWSQFKDKVPYLFEIFATLDSAVTVGRHGAKTFLMRDGKESVQCVFYENEQELPRLIRGQIHRCVGNYDRSSDVLVCVSIRPGLPSELRNAHEAVKACDAEMRALVKSFREV